MTTADTSTPIADRAVALMRRYGPDAAPRSYELWYVYANGLNPGLNDAMKSIVERGRRLAPLDVDALFETHMSEGRLAAQAERTGSGLLAEMDQISGVIDCALGSSRRYRHSLQTLSAEASAPLGRERMTEILDALVAATHEVATSNATLEKRLEEARSEVDSLRTRLDVVRQESLTDPLTGIANRKHFEATLMRSVEGARRDGTALTLIVIDIDEFKRFNDLYGHLTGDQVLRLVGAAMRENVAGDGTLARFGGEEFGIILPRTSTADALNCAEKIRRDVMGRELLKRSTGESLGRVTVSLGIASIRPDDEATSLLERADLCMYRAKRSGRNRTVTDLEPSSRDVSDAA